MHYVSFSNELLETEPPALACGIAMISLLMFWPINFNAIPLKNISAPQMNNWQIGKGPVYVITSTMFY